MQARWEVKQLQKWKTRDKALSLRWRSWWIQYGRLTVTKDHCCAVATRQGTMCHLGSRRTADRNINTFSKEVKTRNNTRSLISHLLRSTTPDWKPGLWIISHLAISVQSIIVVVRTQNWYWLGGWLAQKCWKSRQEDAPAICCVTDCFREALDYRIYRFTDEPFCYDDEIVWSVAKWA